jgi:hypothetical protein
LVQIRQCVLIALALFPASAQNPRFYPDDPIWEMPRPLAVDEPHLRKIDHLYDFILNSVAPPGDKQLPGKPIAAQDTNTLGEVPNSTWYTNRHYWHPMSLEDLKRGPARDNNPAPPFKVVGAKTEGITPGFQIQDARGRRFLCKPDPATNPEMATAADVVSSKFLYALGYNVPENYIFYFTREQLAIAPSAKVAGLNGKERAMNAGDLRRILARIPRDREGRYRMMASLFISGKSVGPFRWYGVRNDDPDDLYRHENRRALRGLQVFCAWLNHTDVKANNTYDTIVDVAGKPAIVHYLIDFGASLGSDSDTAKNARFGHEYMIETDSKVLLRMAALGFYTPDWERAHYPDLPAVGRFEGGTFKPDEWTSNYPNSAFMNRLPDDTFWAAKQVMQFTAEEIRVMAATGEYSNPQALDYMVDTLIKRREKIGQVYFSRVLPLDRFAVRGGALQFEDLGVKHHFTPARDYSIRWFRFDNDSGRRTPIDGATSARVPSASGYLAAEISAGGDAKLVRVFINGNKVVGIDRTW